MRCRSPLPEEERRMTHEQTNAMWLARWQGLRSSGLKMVEYARREGFNAHSAYRWLRRARRSGQWSDSAAQSGKAITVTKTPAPVQFARVMVRGAPAAGGALLLRLVLTNGRRAELEVGGVAQLGEVLDMLERRA
jgi:transposase-like protein